MLALEARDEGGAIIGIGHLIPRGDGLLTIFAEQQRQCGDIVPLQGRDQGLHRLIRGGEGTLCHGACVAGNGQSQQGQTP
ncbi:hypothetical protein D3C85_1597450 [compost metagenome]